MRMHRTAVTSLVATLVFAACVGTRDPGTLAPSAVAIASTSPTAAATIGTNPPPSPIPGCLPKCWFGHSKTPGLLSGAYTTSYFFGGGLTVVAPDGWTGYEDSTGELAIGPTGIDDARVELWIDVYAAKDPAGTPDTAVERTADAIIPWFLDKPVIDVIQQAPATLGGLPATSIEYRRNAKGRNEDPECPAELRPCSVAFGYPEWDGAFGEGSRFHSRLVVMNAMWGGEPHSVYALFSATDALYDRYADAAIALVDGAVLPAGVAAAVPTASP
jgi:hypothetical protein